MDKFLAYFGARTAGSPTLSKYILRNVGGVAGARLVSIAAAFASSVLLARVLGPEKYGAYTFVIALMTSLALFSCLGTPALIIREVAKYAQLRHWGLIRGLFRSSHLLVLCVSGIAILLVAIASVSLKIETELDRWWLILISLPIIFLISLSYLRSAFLTGLSKVALAQIPDMVVRPAVFLAMILWLMLLGDVTVEAVIIIQIVACVASLIAGLFVFRLVTSSDIKKATPKYDRKEWTSAMAPFMGIAGVSFLNVEFIDIFLGISGTNNDMAIFRVAANLGLLVALPLVIIESVMSPRITQVYQSGDRDALQYLARAVAAAASFASMIPAIVLVLYGSEIISWLYGEQYASGFHTLVVIVIGYFVVNLIGLPMQLLYATEYHAAAFRISAVGAVLTMLLCLLLIPSLGALGAGIVLGFGKALRSVLFSIEAKRRLFILSSVKGFKNGNCKRGRSSELR